MCLFVNYFNPRETIEFSRNALPHWSHENCIYFVTWRLVNSVPKSLLLKWTKHQENRFDLLSASDLQKRYVRCIETFLDEGIGECFLRQREVRELLIQVLESGNGDAYCLLDWVIMPNHVHVLFSIKGSISVGQWVRSWKGRSARLINEYLGREGSIWQSDYWDRIIRDEAHFRRCQRYIRQNPLKAKLAPELYTLSGNDCSAGD